MTVSEKQQSRLDELKSYQQSFNDMETFTSEHVDELAYMATQFPQYSELNRIALWIQFHLNCWKITDIKDVSGFNTFAADGRSVSKGAHGLWIYAPLVGKAKKKDGSSTDVTVSGSHNETHTGKTQIFGFVPAAVFADIQTEISDAEKWNKAKVRREKERAEKWALNQKKYRYNFSSESSSNPRSTNEQYIPKSVSDAMAVLGITILESSIAKASYRALSKINHPDHGGDVDLMKKINLAYSTIEKYLEPKNKNN